VFADLQFSIRHTERPENTCLYGKRRIIACGLIRMLTGAPRRRQAVSSTPGKDKEQC